jgi:acetyl esterase/lipase
MDLWPDHIDAMRDEARKAVDASMAAIMGVFGKPDEPPADPVERARLTRARYDAFGPAPEGTDRTIAGVRCRVFVPEGDARAVYLHFHGGGMVSGAPEVNDTSNLALSRQHGVAVVSVDYRLAPEHPHPAGPDDGIAVAAWLLDHAEAEWGSDRLLIGGESAGGYMTAAVTLRVRDELHAIERVLGANMVFGWFDWGFTPSQRGMRATDGPDLLDPEGLQWFADCYLPGRTPEERRDPSASPLYADLRGLVPAMFSVGTGDHLLDDTLLMAARWRAAGNPVELFVAPDMPHGFQAFPCGITREWAAANDAWLTRVLRGT